SVKQVRPRPTVAAEEATVAPSPVAVSPGVASTTATPPSPAATPAAEPAATAPTFPEVTEVLRNSDLELHLTNRGGGIANAVLLNHTAEENKRVTLNWEGRQPIGAIIENPSAPIMSEYKLTRDGDAVACEFVTPDQI